MTDTSDRDPSFAVARGASALYVPDELDALYRNVPFGLALLDCDLRILRVNDALAKVDGISVEAHLGRHLRDVVPELAPVLEPLLRQVIATGEPIRGTEVHGTTLGTAGEPRSWAVDYYPVKTSAGEVAAVGVIVRETTRRKRTEVALRERDERLNVALAVSRAGTYRWHIRSGLVDEDANVVALRGGPCRTAEGFLAKIHSEDRGRVAAVIRRAIDEAVGFDLDYRIVWPDGSVHWLSDLGRMFTDADGRPLHVTGACADIDDRKRDEERLRELARQRDLVLKDSHHRIKNSIAAIAAILRTQTRFQTSDAARTELLDAVRRIGAIGRVHKVLYLSETFDTIDIGLHLEAVMGDVAASTVTALGGRPTIDVACPAGICLPAETVVPLSLIAIELVVNAVRHARPSNDGVNVHVDCAFGDALRLVVSDNGTDIRADDAMEAGGFGLRLVRLLTQQLNGRLTFNGNGRGTTATLIVPHTTAEAGQ